MKIVMQMGRCFVFLFFVACLLAVVPAHAQASLPFGAYIGETASAYAAGGDSVSPYYCTMNGPSGCEDYPQPCTAPCSLGGMPITATTMGESGDSSNFATSSTGGTVQLGILQAFSNSTAGEIGTGGEAGGYSQTAVGWSDTLTVTSPYLAPGTAVILQVTGTFAADLMQDQVGDPTSLSYSFSTQNTGNLIPGYIASNYDNSSIQQVTFTAYVGEPFQVNATLQVQSLAGAGAEEIGLVSYITGYQSLVPTSSYPADNAYWKINIDPTTSAVCITSASTTNYYSTAIPAECTMPPPPCGAPTITFNGADIAGTTTSVVVGQQIQLTGQAPTPACVAATDSQQWSLPLQNGVVTKNAVGGFDANNMTGAVVPLPNDTGLTMYGPFYFTVPGTYTITYQYALTNGMLSPVSTATFTVAGPTDVRVYTCGGNVPSNGCTERTDLGTVNIGAGPCGLIADCPILELGGYTANTGIEFTAYATEPAGYGETNFEWFQLITNDVETLTPTSGKIQLCSPDVVAPVPESFPGLDTQYPAPAPNGFYIADNPSVPLPVGNKKESNKFSATMYLMWRPNPDPNCAGMPSNCAIPVPLGYVQWKFNGVAELTDPDSNTWTVQSGSGSAKRFVPSTSYPTWTGWVPFDNTHFSCANK